MVFICNGDLQEQFLVSGLTNRDADNKHLCCYIFIMALYKDKSKKHV